MSGRIVGLITARGGSKAIPRKNVIPVAGKPLIGWTIEAALSCTSLSDVIISTDDPEIASVSRGFGARVPFIRPAELSDDTAPHNAVIVHAIEWLRQNDPVPPDYIVLLQPTSPLRTNADIDAAVHLAVTKQADSVVSVCAAPVHPFWTRKVADDGRISEFMDWPERSAYVQRQTLPSAFALNGAIYVIRTDTFISRGTYFTDRCYAYVMPEERSLDIDTPFDLKMVDLLLLYGGAL